ncbi:MAG TPA: zf-HC2 domain-containing protein [Burkholderiales bacterium]|nr:zf-HC2 domain-containing protein [Burkholderiales bacterium]
MTHEACPRIEALSALVDDALAGPERAAIEAHAAICPVCGASLARLNELLAGFAALPAPRVGFDLAPAVAARIRAATRPARPARPARQAWWQGLPVALGTAAALGAGAFLGVFLVAGGGVAAVRPAVEMSAFGTVPPGGLCLGPACDGGR